MNIVVASPSIPYVAGKGHETHGYQRLRALAERGHQISLVCLTCGSDPQSETKLKDLASLGVRCRAVRSGVVGRAIRACFSVFSTHLPAQIAWHNSRSFNKRLGEAIVASKADLLHCITVRIVGNIPASPPVPLSIDFIDSLGLNFQRRLLAASVLERPFFRREAALIARYEKKWAEAADLGFIVSSIDRDVIHCNSLKVSPVGVDLSRFGYSAKRESSPQSICFTGNMNYAPNDAAARWFICCCWPQIRQSIPGCSFVVAGRKPSAGLLRLAREHAGVYVLGEVDSMQRILREASVAVAPMTLGSGMQNKILEAMSVGTPVVTNRLGLGDIRATTGTDVMCAEGADGIASAVVCLLKSKDLRAAIARNARTLVERQHDWNVINACFESQVVELAHNTKTKMKEVFQHTEPPKTLK